MFQYFNQNCKKLLKDLLQQIRKSFLKTGLFLGLVAYWGVILAGTFLTLN
jgi:hypothetical protein|tara:strand:- start:1912 stop:2061 length:150 start_codon:yes stop_codon:yes gene_type:complete